jgi:hypothetical protein
MVGVMHVFSAASLFSYSLPVILVFAKQFDIIRVHLKFWADFFNRRGRRGRRE